MVLRYGIGWFDVVEAAAIVALVIRGHRVEKRLARVVKTVDEYLSRHAVGGRASGMSVTSADAAHVRDRSRRPGRKSLRHKVSA